MQVGWFHRKNAKKSRDTVILTSLSELRACQNSQKDANRPSLLCTQSSLSVFMLTMWHI